MTAFFLVLAAICAVLPSRYVVAILPAFWLSQNSILAPNVAQTVPRFETGAEKYRWLMENLFVGSAARHADRVVIDVHQVL